MEKYICDKCLKEFKGPHEYCGHRSKCGKTMTEEHCKAISEGMKKGFKKGTCKGWHFINSDPNRQSPAEKFIESILKKEGIFEKYNVISHFPYKKYFLDFAIIDIKLDLEVDGQQHYNSNEALEHDKIRNEFLETNGWKIYRICWSKFQKNRKEETKKLLNYITEIDENSSYYYDIDEIKLKKVRNIRSGKEYFQNIFDKIKECGIEIKKENVSLIEKKIGISSQRIVRAIRKIDLNLLPIKIRKGIKKEKKYKNQQDYFVNKREKFIESQQEYKDLILNSNINFSKRGWVNKVSKIINQKPQKVNNWMKKIMPDFYKEKCYKRNAHISPLASNELKG